MSKATQKIEGAETGPTTAEPRQAEPVYQAKLISVDQLTGTVVYETDAPDGIGFDARIDGHRASANAHSGQIWFRVHGPLSADPLIYLA